MVSLRKALSAVALAWVCASGAHALDLGGAAVSADARYVAQWVLDSHDNGDKPFVIVDKKDATVFVFGAKGTLVGATPALLGFARGDHSVPGVGELAPARIPLADRTTPAGSAVDSALGRRQPFRPLLGLRLGCLGLAGVALGVEVAASVFMSVSPDMIWRSKRRSALAALVWSPST